MLVVYGCNFTSIKSLLLSDSGGLWGVGGGEGNAPSLTTHSSAFITNKNQNLLI